MSTAEPGSFKLPSPLTALRHHLVLIAVTYLVVLGAAYAYISTTERTYTAESVVLVSPVPGNPLTEEAASGSGTQLSVAMETEAGTVTTPAIDALASTLAGRLVPDDGERLNVEVPGGTQTVRISFSSDSPESAQQGAQAFADAYLQYRGDRAEESQSSRLDRLQAQAESADENLRRASTEAAQTEATQNNAATYASQEVQLYADRLAQLNESISTTEVVSTDPGRVLNPAGLPASPDGVRVLWLLVAAGVVGLLLGALAAVLREWRKDLIREESDFEVNGVPIFATVGYARNGSAFFGDGHPANREAYRRLRAGLVANGPRPHVLAVAAVDTSEHASLVASNLSVAMAEAGFSVLVVAADPHDLSVEASFDVRRTPGLSEVVTAGLPPEEAFTTSSGVTILPAGAEPEGSRELYAGPEFRRVVDEVRSEFDYVIVAAAGAGTADGDAVIGAADSVLMVLTSSRTTHARVAAAQDRCARLGITILGAVMVPHVALPRHRQGSTSAEHQDTDEVGDTDVMSRKANDDVDART